MPLQDTGLDFYESSMRPVRAGVQSIITRAEQNRKELEAEKVRIAAEERADARSVEREKRAEAEKIRTEERTKAYAREGTVAQLAQYGLALTEPDGSRSTDAQLKVRLETHLAKLGPREKLMANITQLEKILPPQTVAAIRNDELTKEQYDSIYSENTKSIELLRAGNREGLRRGTPQYEWEVEQAKVGLYEISKRLGEIQGKEVMDYAQEVVDDFNAGRVKPDEYARIAGTHAAGDPNAQVLMARDDLKPARATKVELPGRGWVDVGSLTPEERAAAEAGGEIDIKGITWALMNKPAQTITGEWPVGVVDGQPITIYHGSISDPERQQLLGAYVLGLDKAAEASRARGEVDYWAAELQLDAEALKFKPFEVEIKGLLDARQKILSDHPDLWGYNAATNTVNPPPDPAKKKVTDNQADLPEDTEGSTDNALAQLDAAAATTAAATTTPTTTAPTTTAPTDDLAEARAAAPALPAAVAPAAGGGDREPTATELADAQARVDLPLEEFIEQSRGPALYNEDTGELLPLDANGNPIVPEYTDAPGGEPGFEPFGLPSYRGGPDDAAGRRADYERLKEQGHNPQNMEYYWREKLEDEKAAIAARSARPSAYEASEGLRQMREKLYGGFAQPGDYDPRLQAEFPARREVTPPTLMSRTPPLDAQGVSEIMGGRPATSREAQEGLRRMREELYGSFAQPGDYDPRLPGAINAIRGQLGQAPPPLGQSPRPALMPRRPKTYGELREAQRQQQAGVRANSMKAINVETPSDRAAKARLYHLYKNPLYGRGKKGGQRLMELAAQSRR